MRESLSGFHLLVRSLLLAIIAGALIAVLAFPSWRWQIDATKTRAYTLSEQTVRLLGTLEGAWSVTIVVAEDGVDPALLRQIDEVLRRIRDSGPVAVDRIDPTDPRSLDRWISLLERLQGRWADETTPFRERLDEATDGFVRLRDFAAAQRASLERLEDAAAALPSESRDEMSAALQTVGSGLVQLSLHGDAFLDGLREFRQSSSARPIPDDESARAALLANHRHWSEQLHGLSQLLERYAALTTDPSARQVARSSADASARLALDLRRSQDRLARLPALELSDLARAIAEGETAIVSGPLGTTAIPSWQLLPRLAAGGEDAPVRFDRRFRGEQVIAAAIRSLRETPPTVVLVHAEERSLLRSTTEGSDLHAITDALRASRIEVREWFIADAAAPSIPDRSRAVWMVVPPMTRRGVETSAAERLLIDRTRALLDRGEPVLMTLARSLLPAFRQRDPWSALVAELGVEADTGTVIFELDRTGTGRGAVRPWQVVERGTGEHPLGKVIDGLATLVTHPTPLRPIDRPGLRTWPLLMIEPAPSRWLETDWRTEGQQRSSPPAGSLLDEPVAVAMAVDRSGADAAGSQRVVVVGSGGWLHSSVVGASESLGGGRLALTSPGNRELLLGAVHWLAAMDDLVVPGPSGRELARLAGLDPTARTLWSALAIIGLPASALAIGGLVAIRRRRS